MANIHKTARGKIIDMDKLRLANEDVSAVGNMRVNARGDRLGAGNQVASGRNAMMDQVYSVPDAPTGEGHTPKSLVPQAPENLATQKPTTKK